MIEKENFKISIDNENKDILLEGEYALLSAERLRRSNEQTQYLKFVLMGIIGQFAILITEFTDLEKIFFEKISSNIINIGMLMISGSVVVLTTILFIFWLDHALTISVIDHFFKEKERKNGLIGWHTFREEYSKSTFIKFPFIQINLMNLKINLFKFSIFTSFLISPALFVLIALIHTGLEGYQDVMKLINIVVFMIFSMILVFGLFVWTYSGRGLYFKIK